MKERSLEALARRAARRGRTLEEQKALDRGLTRGPTPKKLKEQKTSVVREPKTEEKSASVEANDAQQSRMQSTRPSHKTDPRGADKSVSKCERKFPKKQSDPRNAWDGSQVTAERLAENRLLREKFKEKPDSMTVEERERAEQLIARDQRKKEKKERMKAERLNRAEKNRIAHENRHKDRVEKARMQALQKRRERLAAKHAAKANSAGGGGSDSMPRKDEI